MTLWRNSLLFLVAAALFACSSPPVPTDHDLVNRFRNDGNNKLNIIFDEAWNRQRAAGDLRDRLDSSILLTVARDPQYRQILDLFGIESVSAFPPEWGEGVLFRCASVSTEDGTIDKGYAFAPLRPDRVSSQVDSEPPGYVVGTPHFRHIGGGLYVYYVRSAKSAV